MSGNRLLQRQGWPVVTRLAALEADADTIEEAQTDGFAELRGEMKELRKTLIGFSLTVAASALALCGSILVAST